MVLLLGGFVVLWFVGLGVLWLLVCGFVVWLCICAWWFGGFMNL